MRHVNSPLGISTCLVSMCTFDGVPQALQAFELFHWFNIAFEVSEQYDGIGVIDRRIIMAVFDLLALKDRFVC